MLAIPDKVKKRKGKKKVPAGVKKEPQVDVNYLSCAHHRHILTCLAWLGGYRQKGCETSLLSGVSLCEEVVCVF